MKKEEDTSIWVDDEEDVIECDEYALHNVICELGNLGFKCNDDNGVVDKIRLKNVDEVMDESDREMLEKKVNELLQHIRDVDCFLHDVAEYTCR